MKLSSIIAAILTLLVFAQIGPAAAQDAGLPPVTNEWTPPLVLDGELAEVLDVVMESDGNGTMVALWVGLPHEIGIPNSPPNYLKTFFARSIDGGETWSEAQELLPIAGEDHLLDREGMKISAGENGVWMASVITRENTVPFVEKYGVVISHDSGQTWSGFVDLSDNLPVAESDQTAWARLVVGYCGNSSWIVMLSTFDLVQYIRSTDDGTTWGAAAALTTRPPTSTPSVVPADIHSDSTGEPVMIAYHDYDFLPSEDPFPPGDRVARFSYDNGVTFGPPVEAFVGATDGAGNWALAESWSLVNDGDGPIPIWHSSDNGQTFTPIPSPPSIADAVENILTFYPDEIAYGESGEIVLIGTGYLDTGTSFRLPVPGLVTRTGDLGETWTPWARLQDVVGDGNDEVPSLGLAASDMGFVSVMYGKVSEPESEAVYSRRLELGTVTAARDWQLYR